MEEATTGTAQRVHDGQGASEPWKSLSGNQPCRAAASPCCQQSPRLRSVAQGTGGAAAVLVERVGTYLPPAGQSQTRTPGAGEGGHSGPRAPGKVRVLERCGLPGQPPPAFLLQTDLGSLASTLDPASVGLLVGVAQVRWPRPGLLELSPWIWEPGQSPLQPTPGLPFRTVEARTLPACSCGLVCGGQRSSVLGSRKSDGHWRRPEALAVTTRPACHSLSSSLRARGTNPCQVSAPSR